MQVTVGIPTYNQAQYIDDALNSCVIQEYRHFKVVVGDDVSSDETQNIVRAKYPSIEFYRNTHRLGRIGNYQKLLYDKRDNAQLYLNLDGDDYLTDPKFISTAVAHIEKLGLNNVAFYQGNHDLTKVKKVFSSYKVIDAETVVVDGMDYFKNFHKLRHFIHCATLFNREKALPLQFYGYDALYNDFLSMAKLSLFGSVLLSSRKVAEWRSHGQNASSKLDHILLQKEFKGLEDVAEFSKSKIGTQAASQWLNNMKEYFRMTLIYHNAVNAPDWHTFKYMLKHWKFKYFYLSALYNFLKSSLK